MIFQISFQIRVHLLLSYFLGYTVCKIAKIGHRAKPPEASHVCRCDLAEVAECHQMDQNVGMM